MEQEYEGEVYNDELSEEELNDLIQRAKNANQTNVNTSRAINSFSEESKNSNFLHIQISTTEMLDQLEHFYKGSVKIISEGQITYGEQKNKDLITFNDYGVTTLMEIVTKYIDKNTILSNYNEDRINEILADLGEELIMLLLCNYEQMGMDTYFKKTKFRSVITTTLHVIESTYRRSIKAKTLEEMNQSKVVGQFGDQNIPIPRPRSANRSVFSKFFPRT